MRSIFSAMNLWLGRVVSDFPLKRKIALILSVAGIGVVSVTIVLLAIFDWAFSRNETVEEYDSLGEMLAYQLVTFFELGGSEIEARDVLMLLSQRETILYSEIWDADGDVFAVNGEAPTGISRELDRSGYVQFSYLAARIEALRPVESGDSDATLLGYVYLVGDLSPIYRAFFLKTGLFLGTLTIAGVLVLWMAARMSRLITEPILGLAATAKRISKDRDFSHRQVKVFNDETGALVDAFNEMMKQIEERGAIIQSNEERFREYFELGFAGMAILDEAGKFVEVNKQLSEMLDVENAVLLSSSYDDWVEPKEGDGGVSPFGKVRKHCVSGFAEERWLTGNSGGRFFSIISVRRLAKVVGVGEALYLALFQDISDRKKVEEELLASKQAAEEANRSKDEFLSVMSHELRTPLNPIIGFVDLLTHAETDEEKLSMLQSVSRSSQHLLTLITDILDFTRAQGGQFEPSPEAFDLREICCSALDIAQRIGFANQVDVQVRRVDDSLVPPGLRLFSDAGKIRQIVINFVSNAIKYNKQGGSVWIDAEVRPSALGEAELCIQVEDTGLGISKENLGLVFEPFTQLDMSLQRRHEGVGLGLSICKRIGECLGGKIEVESSLGFGSTFSVRIPIRYVRDEREGSVSRETLAEFAPSALAPSRVLLVEDDFENMRLMEVKLRKLGVDFEWAKNGLDATEKVRGSRFDLVLMDVRMPLMDGLEATRVIRDSELSTSSSRVPIVAMTAHASERMKMECAQVGMDGYMSKPVQFDQLEGYIKRYLAG